MASLIVGAVVRRLQCGRCIVVRVVIIIVELSCRLTIFRCKVGERSAVLGTVDVHRQTNARVPGVRSEINAPNDTAGCVMDLMHNKKELSRTCDVLQLTDHE